MHFFLPAKIGLQEGRRNCILLIAAGSKSKACAKGKIVYLASMQKKSRIMKRKAIDSPGAGWFVYVVRCRDGSLYTGITNALERRLSRHDAGKASRYTRSRLPVRLVYQEPSENRSSALKREWAIKAMTRRGKLAMIRLFGRSVRSSSKRQAS